MRELFKSILYSTLIIVALVPFASISQQSSFYKIDTTPGIEFNYKWLSSEGPKALKFELSHTDIENLPNSASAYNPILAQNYIQRSILEYAKTVDPRVARISIRRIGASLEIEVSGGSQQQIDKISEALRKRQDKAEADYLVKNYYVPFTNQMGQKVIKQDHLRYASESSDSLSEIVSAISAQITNPKATREFIDFTLNWLQTIPYDTLDNRVSSNGSGFAAPRQLLLNNKGDCDSKSTLFLALLKSYNPNVSAKMILLPNHALVAVRLKPNKTDEVMQQGGLTYILAEPTGAAQYKLGEIAPSSSIAIRNRQFTTELF